MRSHIFRGINALSWTLFGVLLVALIFGNSPGIAQSTAQPAVDPATLAFGQQVLALLGFSVPGLAGGIAAVNTVMSLLKIGSESSLFHAVPARYRSVLPVLVGTVVGGVMGLGDTTPFWQDVLVGGTVMSGASMFLYQQVKGTGLETLLVKITGFIPRAQPHKIGSFRAAAARG